MKFYKYILLLLILLPLTAGKAHKFYVSTTQIEYAEAEQSLQIISKIFTDDIEAVLQKRYNKPQLELASKKETKEDEALLKEYILKKIKIWVNNQPQAITYVGREYDIDIVKVYLEIKDVSTLKTIEVENKLLQDIFPEQQNIIHFKWNKTRKSLLLDKDNPKGLLKF